MDADSIHAVFMAYFEGIIDETRMLMIFAALEEDYELEDDSKSYGDRLDLNSLTSAECKDSFRFTKEQLLDLCDALQLPDVMKGPNRSRWSGIEGLCVLLRRLCYPNRLCDLEHFFGRPSSTLSIISNCVCLFVYRRWRHLLDDFASQPWFTPDILRSCVEAVNEKAGLPPGIVNLWGFIDGTLRECCKPQEDQRVYYSGHKRSHGIKFQAVVAANGIFAHMFGPMPGSRHDAAVLLHSDLLRYMQDRLPIPAPGQVYQIYGDQAYPLKEQLLRPYHNPNHQEALFNTAVSKLRMSVEWGFGEVQRAFSFIDFKKNLKLYLQPIGAYYTVAVLLINCRTCLNGRNEISDYFQCQPPALNEYLR
eukprot:scpid79393/ scgid29877/ 